MRHILKKLRFVSPFIKTQNFYFTFTPIFLFLFLRHSIALVFVLEIV